MSVIGIIEVDRLVLTGGGQTAGLRSGTVHHRVPLKVVHCFGFPHGYRRVKFFYKSVLWSVEYLKPVVVAERQDAEAIWRPLAASSVGVKPH